MSDVTVADVSEKGFGSYKPCPHTQTDTQPSKRATSIKTISQLP